MINNSYYFNFLDFILWLYYDYLFDVFNFLNFCYMKNGNCIDLILEKCIVVNIKKVVFNFVNKL